jgi:hypothetical protein
VRKILTLQTDFIRVELDLALYEFHLVWIREMSLCLAFVLLLILKAARDVHVSAYFDWSGSGFWYSNCYAIAKFWKLSKLFLEIKLWYLVSYGPAKFCRV